MTIIQNYTPGNLPGRPIFSLLVTLSLCGGVPVFMVAQSGRYHGFPPLSALDESRAR
jgi:hypothetical protein